VYGIAAEITRAQPRRKHLAIYARQLALKPHLQILRRHFGPLLFCLEQLIGMPWKIMSIGSNSRALTTIKQTLSVAIDKSGGSFGMCHLAQLTLHGSSLSIGINISNIAAFSHV
jgi:hypothetical protein